ncbi:hypothetical protein ACLOJK_006916, partial [Asimina triloba]
MASSPFSLAAEPISTSAGVRPHQPGKEADSALLHHLQSTSSPSAIHALAEPIAHRQQQIRPSSMLHTASRSTGVHTPAATILPNPSRSALPAADAPTSSPPASETHLHPATSSDRPRAELITPKSGQQLHDWPSSICNHGSPSMLHASGEQSSIPHHVGQPRSNAPLSQINPRSSIHGDQSTITWQNH